MAALVLAGCYRNEPTPDPPTAPPTPETTLEEWQGIEPAIYPAIYIFPESEIPDRRTGQVRVVT